VQLTPVYDCVVRVRCTYVCVCVCVINRVGQVVYYKWWVTDLNSDCSSGVVVAVAVDIPTVGTRQVSCVELSVDCPARKVVKLMEEGHSRASARVKIFEDT